MRRAPHIGSPASPRKPGFSSRSRRPRRGLAPLEFVLALPFLILLASLMLVMGGAGLVKDRAQANARYANWRSGSIRNSGDPNPHNWESPAVLLGGGGSDVTGTDRVWNGTLDLQEPALRGSSVSGNGGGMRVDGVLEIGSGVHTGNAQYKRPLPLLRKVFDKDTFAVDLTHEILSDPWEFHEGPFELDRNTSSLPRVSGTKHRRDLKSRGNVWYAFQEEMIFPAMEPHRSALVGANLVDLNPLDDDDELIAERGYPAPDFHPRYREGWFGQSGTFDQLNRPGGHIDQVRRVPGRMAQTFINMYQQQINSRQAQIDALKMGMPVDGAAIAQLEGEITAIEAKLGPMQKFYNSLPKRNQ